MSLQKLTLILGGASSGKSRHAESLVLGSGLRPVYIATMQVWDDEAAARVTAHLTQRGSGWRTVEEPLDMAAALATVRSGEAVLLDCATLWLTNRMLAGHDLDAACDGLLAALAACPTPVVVVSNEVGQGIVPDNALARRFREAQGTLNQRLAARADRVEVVMAGLPLVLKAGA